MWLSLNLKCCNFFKVAQDELNGDLIPFPLKVPYRRWKALLFHVNFLLACLHDQNKIGFFGEPAFQPIRAFEYFLNCPDWMDKSQPSKKAPCRLQYLFTIWLNGIK